jgi:hypothetical protein
VYIPVPLKVTGALLTVLQNGVPEYDIAAVAAVVISILLVAITCGQPPIGLMVLATV